jgi:hypothetical protein
LFLLYINNLPINIKEPKVVIFADDANILVRAKGGQTVHQKINRVMSSLHSRRNANNFIINTEKTMTVLLHTKQERDPVKPKVKLKNFDIAYESDTKFLGIHSGEYMYLAERIRSLGSVNFVISLKKGKIVPVGMGEWMYRLKFS